jgi:GDPmannose 4,6-dehydratase
MNVAMVIGSEGQDGRLLCDRLGRDGWAVIGIDRGVVRDGAAAGIGPVDILDAASVERAIERAQPAEVYYLAAYHHSSQDPHPPAALEMLDRSFAVHVRGLVHCLEGIRRTSPRSRLFYAASSHIFGEARVCPQDEATPVAPVCAYGITKAAGLHCCRFYRQRHGVFASVGILYNHESPLRAEAFVTQKIARGAARIGRGEQDRLVLGDLSARVDWGWAPDYVEAMTRMLRLDEADDFVVATGEAHSVGEFAETAFALLGLDWRKCVEEKPSILAKGKLNFVGDAGKLRRVTGWQPTVTFPEMVRLLLRAQGAAV